MFLQLLKEEILQSHQFQPRKIKMSNIELVFNPFLISGIITVGKHLFAVDGGGGTIKEVKDYLS